MPVSDGCTVAQKTHHLPSDPSFGEESPYNPVNKLIIVRNPYKAILSLGHFVDTGNHVEKGEEDSFTGSGANIIKTNLFLIKSLRVVNFKAGTGSFRMRSPLGEIGLLNGSAPMAI